MGNTSIEWTERTWNPVRGCSLAPGSEAGGCLNCYAARMAARNLPGMASPSTGEPFAVLRPSGPRWTGAVELIESLLDVPLKRRRPTTWFVNSMSDLFHESLSDKAIARVFAVMALCPQHTFQVLTKRADRMLQWASSDSQPSGINEAIRQMMRDGKIARYPECEFPWAPWPLPNVRLGVSCENQPTADARIPHLLQTPAAVRFISAEPLLGPVDLGLNRWVRLPRPVISELPFPPIPYAEKGIYRATANPHGALAVPAAVSGELLGVKPGEFERLPSLDWVIVGGESGPGARPMDPQWARSIRGQCVSANVPFFFKQWGEWLGAEQDGGIVDGV